MCLLEVAKRPGAQFANSLTNVPQQVFFDTYVQEHLSSVGVLLPYFNSSKGISHKPYWGVLTRFAVKIFFLRLAQCEKKKKFIPTSYVQGQPFPCPQPRVPFLGSWVAGLAGDPSCLKYWLLHHFFYEEAICEGSTGKGLPYAAKAVPAKDYFTHLTLTITLSDQPQLSRVSSMVLLCCWGRSCSKIWHPLWLTLRCMPYGGVRWGSCCEAFVARKACTIVLSEAQGSCLKTSDNQP